MYKLWRRDEDMCSRAVPQTLNTELQQLGQLACTDSYISTTQLTCS